MPNNKINYSEIQSFYELCSEARDLKEFCKDAGVNYEKFVSWQRRQLWNEKLGKTEDKSNPAMSPIRITDIAGYSSRTRTGNSAEPCPFYRSQTDRRCLFPEIQCNPWRNYRTAHQTYLCLMLVLSATYNYYLFNGSVDMRKGVFGLAEAVRKEMAENPLNGNNVFIFMSKNRKVVKILHYEEGTEKVIKSTLQSK